MKIWVEPCKLNDYHFSRVYTDENINGKTFLDLPLDKKTFQDHVRHTVTIGGWDNIVNLIKEALKGELLCQP